MTRHTNINGTILLAPYADVVGIREASCCALAVALPEVVVSRVPWEHLTLHVDILPCLLVERLQNFQPPQTDAIIRGVAVNGDLI